MEAPELARIRVAAGIELAVRRWPAGGRSGRAAGGGGNGERRYLLVHGLASNARMWDGVAVELQRGGAAVAAVDLRGHGLSGKPAGGYRTPEVAADLGPLLDGLGWQQVVLAGQSWGCNVVLQFAADQSERVSAVACIDGGLGDLADRFPRWEDCLTALSPPRSAGTPAAGFEERIRAAHPDWPESGIAGVLGCFEFRTDGTLAPWLTFDRHLQVLRGMWEQRISALLPRLPMPVLFVPADDPARPDWTAAKRAAAGPTLAALPDGRISWLSGEHDLHAQHPVLVAARLAELADTA